MYDLLSIFRPNPLAFSGVFIEELQRASPLFQTAEEFFVDNLQLLVIQCFQSLQNHLNLLTHN